MRAVCIVGWDYSSTATLRNLDNAPKIEPLSNDEMQYRVPLAARRQNVPSMRDMRPKSEEQRNSIRRSKFHTRLRKLFTVGVLCWCQSVNESDTYLTISGSEIEHYLTAVSNYPLEAEDPRLREYSTERGHHVVRKG